MRRVLPLLVASACARLPPQQVELGAPAPRFVAETLNEEWSRVARVDLEEAVGAHAAVLLSFGASYCGPCMLEWPLLRDLALEYQRRGLLVVFVVIDREPEGVEAMRVITTRQLGIASPVVGDPDGELARRYRIDHLPQLYLLDDRGEVVWREIGYRSSTIDELIRRLEPMLVQAESSLY